MPRNVRLFIFRSAEGRLIAQFWDGMHALFDKPHVAHVRFPPGSARVVNVFGKPVGDAVGEELALSDSCP